MKKISNIFSVFLAFSVLVAASYCCCIKEALAKKTYACCAQKSSHHSNSCHQKGQTCPKSAGLFNDQALGVKQASLPQLSLAQTFQHFSTIFLISHPVHSAFDGPPIKSLEAPLYITQRKFRI